MGSYNGEQKAGMFGVATFFNGSELFLDEMLGILPLSHVLANKFIRGN